jgi:antitoxin (DNA-binding transcriptional repressor) of toxin-antitoxin stability system
MRRISAAEANRQFSRIMRAAMAGETVIVTDRGKPAVKIEAFRSAPDDADRARAFTAFMEKLRGQPVLDAPRLTREDFYD